MALGHLILALATTIAGANTSPAAEDGSADVTAGAAVVLVSGTSPKATVGLGLNADLIWPSLSLQFGARLDRPTRFTVGHNVGVDVATFQASAAPCLRDEAMHACAVLTAGAIDARGDNLQNGGRSTTPTIGVGGRLAAVIALGSRIDLVLRLDFIVALTQVTLRLADEPVWTSPRNSGAIGVGVRMHLP